MNREFFVVGTMGYGGVGLLMLVGLLIAARDLARALLLPHHHRSRVLRQRRSSPKPFLQSKQSQINQ